MKHLFTLSERLKGRGRGSVTSAISATSASAIFCKLVGMVKLFMPFMKATKRQSDTTIFAESAESAKSAKPIFANRGVKDVRVSLDQYSTNIQRISNLYITPNRYFTRFAAVFALVFCLGVGNVWADYTITFKTSTGTSDGTSAKTSKSDVIYSGGDYVTSSFSASYLYYGANSSGIRFGSGNYAGAMTLPLTNTGTSVGQIKASKITFKDAKYYSSDGSSLEYEITYTSGSSNTSGSIVLTNSAKDYDVELDETRTISQIHINATAKKKRFYITAIEIAEASTTPSYNIIATRNNNEYGTVSVIGTTITATPADCYQVVSGTGGYSVTSGTATVSHTGNSNTLTVTPSSNCTICVNFEKKTVNTYIDEIQDNGEFEDCSTSAPSLTDKSAATTGTCAQQHYHFVGWVTAANKANPTDANIIEAGETIAVNGTTYYAVWAKGTGGGSFDGEHGGSFKIYANVSGTNHYATGTGSKISSTTTASDATEYIFTKVTENNKTYFTIKTGNDYITKGSSNTDFGTSTTAYNWIVIEGTHGSWRIVSSTVDTRGFIYRASTYNVFGTYTLNGINGTEYYDLEIGGSTSYSDYITNCCEELAQVEGSVSWSQPTEAVVSWDNIDHVSSWTVKYKTHGAGAYSTWAGDQTTADGKRSVTITGLAACTDYDFQIIANPASGYCDKDLTIEDNQIHNWTVTTTGVTNATPNEAWPATTCTGFSTTVTAASGYDLPSTITVTGANHTWDQATGALTISNVTGDVAITITPTVHTYSITYKDQGGADFSGTQTDAPTSHTYGTATTLKIPTKANNNFGGWFTSVDCTTGAVGDAESATLGATDYTADIVLYAKWVANQHTLTYSEGDAESGSVPAEPTLYDHGHKVTVLGNTGELVKEHYVFETWTDGENEYGEGDNFNIYDDVTLSPKWACNEYVNVSKGTPTNGSFELSATGSRYTCEGEEIITVTPSANTGYAFSAIEVTGVAGAINQTAKTVTYAQYAHGTSTINVTFAPVVSAITWDLNYQGAPTASSTDYTYAGEALVLPAPTRTGYDFVGWFTDPTDGSQIDNVGGSNKPYAATTYYAHWTIKNYTVTWKVAGNDYTTGVSASNNNANYNTTVSAPTAPAASLLGEQGCADTFMGWSKKNGGHDAKAASYYDDLFTTTSPEITDNTTFYAVFAQSDVANGSATFNASDLTATPETANSLEWQHTASGIKLKLSSGNHYTKGQPNTFTIDAGTTYYAEVTAASGQTITGATVTTTIDANNSSKHYCPGDVSSGSRGDAVANGDYEDYAITGTITSPLKIYATNYQMRVVELTVNYSTTSYSDYVTECAPLTCSVPQSLASTPGKNGATLSWGAPEVGTASKYQYAVWAVGADEPTSGYSETTNLTATVSGLMSDTEYNWKVRTVCTGTDGESEFAKSTFTTGSVDLTFSVPTGVSSVTASTSASALPSAGVPESCAGCWSFAGWSSDANATSVEYAAGGTYKFDGDKTLYAVYGKGSTTYEWISEIEELATNENYIITAIYSNTEYALTSEKHDSFEKDTKSLDVTAKVEEDENGYYIQNPEANYIWKYTGTKLYNESANKYIQLSNYSSSSILDASGENLTFTVGNDGEWTIKNGSAYLRCYGSGFDASSSSSVYIYKRQLGTFTTNPDCNGHTVEWYVAGEKVRTDEGVSSCDGVASLPSVDVADIRCKTEGTTFMGWSETNVGVTPTSDADEIAALNLFTDAADAPAITADKQFYAVFAEGTPANPVAQTVTYTISAKNTLTTTGSEPTGSSATIAESYSTSKQMTGGNSQTLKLTNFGAWKITKIVLSMRSNQNGGGGSLSYSTDGGETFREISSGAFNTSAWYGSWSTEYVDVTKNNLNVVCGDDDVVIKIAASANSLYCESYAITYEPIITYGDYFTECCPQKAITLSGVDETVGKHFESDKEEACEGETVTLSKTEEGFFNFGGWTVYKTGDKNTTVPVTNNQFEMPDYAVTVEAEWNPKNYKATVASEDNNKGTVSVIGGSIDGDDFQVAYGSPLTLTATPVNDDHYFQNWTVTPDMPELDLTQNPLVITMPGNNIDITANFGTVADPPALTLETNEAYTLTATLANGDPIANMGAIRSGTALKVSYVLNGQNEKTGWTLTPATTYGESENYITFNMPSEDLRVALAVRPYYTLGLSAENGTISSVSINSEAQTPTTTSYNVHAGEIVEVVATPTNDTYKFKEWVKTGDAATYSGASTTAMLKVGTENMTLKAVFEAKATYNLTLNALGRTQEVIPALEGTDVASLLEDKNAVTLKGYHFEGWSETEDGEAISGDALKLNGDKTVYAVYSAEAYYQKVTSTDDITDGQYLIVYEDGEVAFNGGLTTLDAENNTIDVTINNGKIDVTNETTAAEFMIDVTAGTIKSASGQYIGQTSDGNGLTAQAEPLTNTMDITSGKDFTVKSSGNAYLRYNSASNQLRFRYYKSSSYTGQKAIQLYKKVESGANESNPTTVVANNEVLVIDADATLNNLTVEAGGKVDGSGNLTVNDFTIEGQDGKSGQVMNADKLTINGDAYFDFTLAVSGTKAANQWHNFSVPFPVSVMDGVYNAETGAKLTNEVDYAIEDYHGDLRAQGKYGWKKYRGIMQPGITYSMTVNGDIQTFRFKKVAGAYSFDANPSVGFSQYNSGVPTDAGWNGLGNMRLCYASVNNENIKENSGVRYVQILDATEYAYKSYTVGEINLTVGSAFFIQAANNGTMTFAAAHNAPNIVYAPARTEAKRTDKPIAVTLSNENQSDRMYITASEDAKSEYQIGCDLQKMFATNTPQAPMIYSVNYGGIKLAAEEAPIVNDKASYALSLYAPANGTYRIETPTESDNADLYLTKDGRVIWNLSMNGYEVELTKGTTEGYGLLLVRKAPSVATGVEEPTSDSSLKGRATKVVIDEHVYILRGGQMYDVTGKAVK